MAYGQQARPQTKLVIDLSVARVGGVLSPPGLPIKQVYVAILPSGADFNLKAGYANPGAPMVQTGSLVYFDPLVDGLYLDNIAQPGLTATLMLLTGSKN